ncbi:MAG: EamA family transporter [Candidatus Peregrinibacteria bacterium]|nr:EamA family transporter [Candidatus Peregrinibacteria bacterium]MDZ4245350.1 EamA family transporter [Candidatus Gracilibacteria bacterium]
MTTLAIVLVLTSAVFHAFKSLFNKTSYNKYAFTLLYWIGGVILTVPAIFVYFWLNDVSEIEILRNVGPLTWGILGASILMHIFYFFTQSKIYIKGDLSLVYPLSRLAPLFVLIWSVLVLHEEITILGLLGIILTIFGTWVIMHRDTMTLKGFFEPFRQCRSLTIMLAFGTSILSAIFSVTDKTLTQAFTPEGITGADLLLVGPALFSVMLTVDVIIVWPIIIYMYRDSIKYEWINNRKNIILASIFDFPGYFMTLMAFLLAPLAYIVSLRQFSVIIGVLFGHFLLKEKFSKFRIIGSIIIFAGCFLISAFG